MLGQQKNKSIVNLTNFGRKKKRIFFFFALSFLIYEYILKYKATDEFTSPNNEKNNDILNLSGTLNQVENLKSSKKNFFSFSKNQVVPNPLSLNNLENEDKSKKKKKT